MEAPFLHTEQDCEIRSSLAFAFALPWKGRKAKKLPSVATTSEFELELELEREWEKSQTEKPLPVAVTEISAPTLTPPAPKASPVPVANLESEPELEEAASLPNKSASLLRHLMHFIGTAGISGMCVALALHLLTDMVRVTQAQPQQRQMALVAPVAPKVDQRLSPESKEIDRVVLMPQTSVPPPMEAQTQPGEIANIIDPSAGDPAFFEGVDQPSGLNSTPAPTPKPKPVEDAKEEASTTPDLEGPYTAHWFRATAVRVQQLHMEIMKTTPGDKQQQLLRDREVLIAVYNSQMTSKVAKANGLLLKL